MKSPADRAFAPTALMLGNFVTGCSVLAPAGMLAELATGLDVTIRDAGLLSPTAPWCYALPPR